MSQLPPIVRTELPAAVPQKRRGGRVPELDGLRGIAILMVLFFHFTTYMAQLRNWHTTGLLFFLVDVSQVGWAGVDLFFVLSGYLITGILLDSVGHRHYYRNFIVRRSLRIFPLYYASLVFYCVLTYLPGEIRWKDFLDAAGGGWYLIYLGNIKAFLANSWPAAAILTPLWSLQVEEQFYFSFPLLVWAAKRRTLTGILLASVAGALLLRVVLTAARPANTLGPYVLMPCRMDPLALGGLIAIIQREYPHWLKNRWVLRLTAAATLVFVLVCLFFSDTPWAEMAQGRLRIDCCRTAAMRTVGYSAIDLAFTGALVMLISGRYRILLGLCRWRILVWLGTISYGLYLLHIPALTITDRWLTPWLRIPAHGSAEVFVSLATAIGLAWFSWVFFESRILKLKDRFTVQ